VQKGKGRRSNAATQRSAWKDSRGRCPDFERRTNRENHPGTLGHKKRGADNPGKAHPVIPMVYSLLELVVTTVEQNGERIPESRNSMASLTERRKNAAILRCLRDWRLTPPSLSKRRAPKGSKSLAGGCRKGEQTGGEMGLAYAWKGSTLRSRSRSRTSLHCERSSRAEHKKKGLRPTRLSKPDRALVRKEKDEGVYGVHTTRI